MKKIKQTKKMYIDLLSVIAAFSVVVMHTNGCYWQFSATEKYWKTANIIEGISYFNVPVFFMISGVTLIDYKKKYGTGAYFIKRATKTVIPFIIWSGIGLLFRVYYLKDIRCEDVNLMFLYNGINRTNIVASIYWFFPALFSIYLFIPILGAIDTDKKVVFEYIAIIGFIFVSFIPFVFRFIGCDALSTKFVAGTSYLIYPVIGYLISNYDVRKWQRISIYFAGAGGVLLKILGTYNDSMNIGKVSNLFSGFDNVPAVLYATAVFLFAKQTNKVIIQNKAICSFITFMRNYTFPIYLMHWFVYRIALKEFVIDTKSILYRLGFPFIIVPIIICITWLLRKIPIVRQIVP